MLLVEPPQRFSFSFIFVCFKSNLFTLLDFSASFHFLSCSSDSELASFYVDFSVLNPCIGLNYFLIICSHLILFLIWSRDFIHVDLLQTNKSTPNNQYPHNKPSKKASKYMGVESLKKYSSLQTPNFVELWSRRVSKILSVLVKLNLLSICHCHVIK